MGWEICFNRRKCCFFPKCSTMVNIPLCSFFLSSIFRCVYPTTPIKLGAGGWSPLDTDRYPWLQVNLGSRKQVVAIVTQGRYGSSDWTSKYRLLYSDTQKNWRPYLQDGNIWVRKNSMSCVLRPSHLNLSLVSSVAAGRISQVH